MISAIHCTRNQRHDTKYTIDKTQHILEPYGEQDIKELTLYKEDVKKSTLNYIDIPKIIADDVFRQFTNLTINVKLNTGNNNTLVDNVKYNPNLKDDEVKVIEPQLPTLDYHYELKPTLLKTKGKPMYESFVPKLQLKFLDEAMRPRHTNLTRNVVINKNNDTFRNERPGLKVKVKISKPNEPNNNDNYDTQTKYVIVNNDNEYTTDKVYTEIKEEKTNDSKYLKRRNVPGFNIESKIDAHFRANAEHETESENVQFLPIQYHVPVLPQFHINRAPLPPILPPRHTLPKYLPVYQSDNLPMHFHAPDFSHLDTISQGNSKLSQFHNLETYFKLPKNNQHGELKVLEKGNIGDDNVNKYLYERNGIPVPRGHIVEEGPMNSNPIRSTYTKTDDVRRGILNKSEEFVDAHIKIPKNLFEHYQRIIQIPTDNIENKNTDDFLTQISQTSSNVPYRKAKELKAERNLQVTKNTNSLGIDTIIRQFLIDPGFAKEQAENLVPKLISILGPEFSTYFGDNPIPAGKIDTEIKKLQNTLETLRKWREFSNNITSTKTYRNTTMLPTVNRTHLTELISHRSHETQALDTSSQIHTYKTTTLNKKLTSKAPIIQLLSTSNAVPKLATFNFAQDTITEHAKTTTFNPHNISYNPLQLEINKQDIEPGDESVFIKKKKATLAETIKSLDRFTMERKKTFTSSPRHLEIIPKAHDKEEEVDTKGIQPYIVKDTVQNQTSTLPQLGLIGKVLNENYLLLSQQSNNTKTASKLPEIMEIQGNDEEIIDAKYISENPEVFDSLRQQTEMMGKLLLNYKKHSARQKNKGHQQQSKDNNMNDFEALIKKLEDEYVSTKHFNNRAVSTAVPIKKINSAHNIYKHNKFTNAPKIQNSYKKSIINKKRNEHSKESMADNKKSSIEFRIRQRKYTENSKETQKETKESFSKEKTDEESVIEKTSQEISSKEISSNDEKDGSEMTNALKNKAQMIRNGLKKALLRNPDLQKILRYCKEQKRRNKLKNRNL